jgi:lipid-binding SYLF domain-containing protein
MASQWSYKKQPSILPALCNPTHGAKHVPFKLADRGGFHTSPFSLKEESVMRFDRNYAVPFMALCALMAGCSTAPKTAEKRGELRDRSSSALSTMESKDATLRDFIDRAYGYAVYPTVGKGGAVAGGAYGHGVVYEQGRQVGYSDLTQASVGAQLGGQSYSEVIVFEDAAALDKLKRGAYSLGAGVSAVLLKSGAAREARFKDGVAVFVHPKAGAMAEASVSGQKLGYKAMSNAEKSDAR